jgi:hypothetical protein
MATTDHSSGVRMRAFLSGRQLQICAAVLLVAAMAHWPYGYYQFLRLAICAAACLSVWRLSSMKSTLWAIALAAIAVLFNPFIPVHLHRADWLWINAGCAAAFLGSPPLMAPHKSKNARIS